jgi:hypothetical protein
MFDVVGGVLVFVFVLVCMECCICALECSCVGSLVWFVCSVVVFVAVVAISFLDVFQKICAGALPLLLSCSVSLGFRI